MLWTPWTNHLGLALLSTYFCCACQLIVLRTFFLCFFFAQAFRFINGKNEACFHMKRNPRKLNWTLFYRRLRKKGTQVLSSLDWERQ